MPSCSTLLTSHSFSHHLLQASALLKSDLNREALDTDQPWMEFLRYLEQITQATHSTVAIRKLSPKLELIDPVASTWPEETLQAFIELDLDPDSDVLHADFIETSFKKLKQAISWPQVLNVREYEKTAFYNEFARPHHIDAAVAVTIPLGLKQVGVFGVHPPSGQYELSQIANCFLEALSDDVALALSHRQLLKELAASRGVLDRLNMGVIFLDERGWVSSYNARAQEILRLKDPLQLKAYRLTTTDAATTQSLQSLIAKMIRGESRQRESQIIVKSQSNNPSLQILAVSLTNQLSQTLFGGYVPVALFINWPYLNNTYSVNLAEIFRDFYHCTPKQAEVAKLFSQGLSENQIATQLGMARETARSHLAEISRKVQDKERSPSRRKRIIFDIAHQHQMPIRTHRDLINARRPKFRICPIPS